MRTHTIAVCSLAAIAAQGWCSQAIASSDPNLDLPPAPSEDSITSRTSGPEIQREANTIVAIASPEVQFFPDSTQTNFNQWEVQPTLTEPLSEVATESPLDSQKQNSVAPPDQTIAHNPNQSVRTTGTTIAANPQVSADVPLETYRSSENLTAANTVAQSTVQGQTLRTAPKPRIARRVNVDHLDDLHNVILIETEPPKMRLPRGTKLPMRMIVVTDPSIKTDTPITDQMEPFIQSTTPSLTTGGSNSGLGTSVRVVEQSREEYSRALRQWEERVRESMRSSPRMVHTIDPEVEVVLVTETDPDEFVPILINRQAGRIVRNASGRLVYTGL